MSKRFGSFMQSPIGAFTESMAHAREQAEPAAGYIIGGTSEDWPIAYLDQYDFPDDKWTRKQPLPRSSFPGGLVGQTGFAVFGRGHVIAGVRNQFIPHWFYNNQEEAWAPLQHPPIGQENVTFPGAGFHGKGYTFGSSSRETEDRDVQRYDYKTDQWKLLQPYPVPTRYFGLAVTIGFNMYFYASARLLGHDSARNDKYDPLTDTWSIAAKAFVVRSNAAGGVVKGHAYFQGGFRSYKDGNTPAYEAYGYNPTTDAWIAFPSLSGEGKESRASHSAFVLNQATSIFVAGGFTLSRHTIRETWQYNWSDETWTQKKRMLSPARHLMQSWSIWQ